MEISFGGAAMDGELVFCRVHGGYSRRECGSVKLSPWNQEMPGASQFIAPVVERVKISSDSLKIRDGCLIFTPRHRPQRQAWLPN